MRLTLPILVLLTATVIAGCGSDVSQSTTAGTPDSPVPIDSAAPCAGDTAGPPQYRHVIWIWMENKNYDAVIGSDSAPYLNHLAEACGLATNYHSIAHPSLPNYIAATSGLEGPSALDRFRTDCDPRPGCTTSARSIFEQAPSWKAYEESMPSRCSTQDTDRYAARHNPPLYFISLDGCVANDVGLDRLHFDLEHDSLPAFAFVTPDACSDTHDCSVDHGDRWLKAEVSGILDSPAYGTGRTALFITYDEGGEVDPPYCSQTSGLPKDSPKSAGCRVATVVVAPTIAPGTTSDSSFDHYSLLRTTEDLLGLSPLGAAARATSMAEAFNLGASKSAAN